MKTSAIQCHPTEAAQVITKTFRNNTFNRAFWYIERKKNDFSIKYLIERSVNCLGVYSDKSAAEKYCSVSLFDNVEEASEEELAEILECLPPENSGIVINVEYLQ